MLHILLLILEIIGIILAVLLGILLLVVLCLLLVPVSYRLKGSGGTGGDAPGLQADIRLVWLFLICKGTITYPPKAIRWRAGVFCFPFYDSVKPKKPKKTKEPKEAKRIFSKKKKEEEPSLEVSWEKPEAPMPEDRTEAGPGALEMPAKSGEIRETRTEEGPEAEAPEREGPPEEGNKLHRLFRAVRCFLQKLIAAVKNIEYTIHKICDRIKKIIGDIQYYTDIVRGETFQEAFHLSKRELGRALRSIRPRRWALSLTAGMGDPASTGQLVAAYGLLYPWIGNHVALQADFDNKILDGRLYMKGRVTVAVLLAVALRLYFDKNLRQLIKLLKKEEA